ncbi:hypothetical protein A5715_00810 [Mycolicibacter heraklionensis]|nr:hypothetical protein A5715_00810 [Mycolicibacter heraklionensis]
MAATAAMATTRRPIPKLPQAPAEALVGQVAMVEAMVMVAMAAMAVAGCAEPTALMPSIPRIQVLLVRMADRVAGVGQPVTGGGFPAMLAAAAMAATGPTVVTAATLWLKRRAA